MAGTANRPRVVTLRLSVEDHEDLKAAAMVADKSVEGFIRFSLDRVLASYRDMEIPNYQLRMLAGAFRD